MGNTPSDKTPTRQPAPGGGKPPGQNKPAPRDDLTTKGGIKPS